MPDGKQVEICGERVTVVEQPVPWLRRRLGALFVAFVDTGDATPAELVNQLEEGLYDALCVLCPDLGRKVPRWSFEGFPSRETFETGTFDDAAPAGGWTLPQLVALIDAAREVNDVDRLRPIFARLAAVVDTDVLRARASLMLAETGSTTGSGSSMSSPSPSGASASTPSATIAGTSSTPKD